jgi:serine/threonine protein kinase/polyhydroxyalkanoate synthesis regulator phasin
MGVVFQGRDPSIGRLVAVKTITRGIADNPDLLERFRREAQAAGSLQHPNIVTIYEMAEFEGTPFIAMEYLEGESLEKKIDARARLPLVHKLGWLVQACRALDYAHRRGVIHRDVKPANIMVTSEGVVKVVDFGIARITDTAKTQTGVLLGTLSYMAPEQVRGQHADQRSDVWALGVVMYELLTSRRPFDRENHAALLMDILNESPRPIAESLPDCPPALENVVQRALQKDPAQRYQTMEALLVDLEPIWTSMQREAVQKLVSHGRELMESGRLEEASEVLRKSLSLDTGNTAVKALFDQVNAQLEATPGAQGDRKKITGDQRRTPSATSRLESAQPKSSHAESRRTGTVAATTPSDPFLTRVMDPSHDRSGASNASAPTPPHLQAGEPGGTIFAPLVPQELRSEPPKIPGPQKSVPPAKPASARSGAPISPAPAVRNAAIGKTAAPSSSGKGVYIAAAIAVLVILGAFGYWKLIPGQRNTPEQPTATSSTQPSEPPATAQPTVPPVSTSANTSPATEKPVNPAASMPAASVEDQQRHLIDLAHEAADSKDYKSAQSRLDEATKLNGPLNPLIKDLRHEFSDEAHGAELRQVAQREQSLWDRSMKAFGAGQWDDAEKQLREILTLPEAGRHWADAARYVDEIIPERRQEDELWANEQQEMNIKGPEHRFNEVKLLDQVLALGGTHHQEARERRETLMTQFARTNMRKNNGGGQGRMDSADSQLSQLQDAVDSAAAKKDAKALEDLQSLRPRFKSMVDAGGPMIFDARDYLSSVIPKTQKAIEDRLSKEEANAPLNAKFREAMKQFDQAVATQNAKMLRNQVRSEFDDIVKAGGARSEEAGRYINELIPAALKKMNR